MFQPFIAHGPRAASHVRSGIRLIAYGVAAGYRASVRLLDERVFPVVVSYSTHPFTIAATMLLLLLLLAFASNTVLVLIANSYLNVASASVSSIVLLMSLKHHRENKRLHAQHTAQVDALHRRMALLEAQSPHADAPFPRDTRSGRFMKRAPLTAPVSTPASTPYTASASPDVAPAPPATPAKRASKKAATKVSV